MTERIRWNDRARKIAGLAYDLLALLACALLVTAGAFILGSL